MMKHALPEVVGRQILRQSLHAIPVNRERLLIVIRAVQQLNRERARELRVFLFAQDGQVDTGTGGAVLPDGNQQEGQPLSPLPAGLPAEIKIRHDRIEQPGRRLGKGHAVDLIGLASVQQAKERVRIVGFIPEKLRPRGRVRRTEHVVRGAGIKALRQDHGSAHSAAGGRGGIPFRLLRRIGAGDLPAIQIRHEAILAAHLQTQALHRGIHELERHAHVGR